MKGVSPILIAFLITLVGISIPIAVGMAWEDGKAAGQAQCQEPDARVPDAGVNDAEAERSSGEEESFDKQLEQLRRYVNECVRCFQREEKRE